MQNSGETARVELSNLNLHCFQKPSIAFGSERFKNWPENPRNLIRVRGWQDVQFYPDEDSALTHELCSLTFSLIQTHIDSLAADDFSNY